MFFLLTLCSTNVLARVDGEVELGYAHFEQSSDNGEDLTGSHFTQRYALMYRAKGLLAGGRAGFYDLGIGAEWGAFESDLGDEEFANDALKYLYEGRLQIAPGGLPFRLNAYSYDTQKIYFEKVNDLDPLNSTNTPSYSLLRPAIVTDLRNGQTIVSGVQFMGGIRNGTYLGKYRELLSQWPRLLVDYRDVYRSDMRSRTPEKSRSRDLAFVSLNKKDNWFHYRVRTHKDYLHAENDERESTLMLGTIDHTLKRQWIDLTNWIRISVDGAYTELERDWDPWKTERFDVNFFTTMQRRDFAANSFANMQRIKRGERLYSLLDLPFFVNYSLNPDTSVRSTFQAWRSRDIREGAVDDEGENAFYTKLLFETGKRSQVRINPSIELEMLTGDRGEGEAVRGKVEAYSNRLKRQNIAWYGMGALALFDGTSDNDEEVSFWESELQGTVSSQLRQGIVLGADQHLLYGAGSYGSQATRYMSPTANQSFDRLGTLASSAEDGSLFRSKSTLYLELTSPSKVTNRFQLFYKYQDSSGVRLDTLELSHRLQYQSRQWRANLEHFYVVGDDGDYLRSANNNLGAVTPGGASSEQFFHRGSLEYRPNKYWLSRLDTYLSWEKGESGGNDLFYKVEQQVERTFYVDSSRRKRGDISQSLIYEQFKDGVDRRAIIFSLSGNYYPTSFLKLGADVSYYDYDFQANVFYYTLITELDFPRFKVDMSYRYGASDYADTVAHRYEVNVRKTF